MYVFGFRANHFTIYVNQLKAINSLEILNEILKERNILLNTDGSEIKGSEELLLKQSSTMEDKVSIEFEEGVYDIPCCYYEFAERFIGNDNEIINGFLSKSAVKNFEITKKNNLKTIFFPFLPLSFILFYKFMINNTITHL